MREKLSPWTTKNVTIEFVCWKFLKFIVKHHLWIKPNTHFYAALWNFIAFLRAKNFVYSANKILPVKLMSLLLFLPFVFFRIFFFFHFTIMIRTLWIHWIHTQLYKFHLIFHVWNKNYIWLDKVSCFVYIFRIETHWKMEKKVERVNET